MQGGIAQLACAPDAPFDVRVRIALASAKTHHELAEQYTDPEDQRRVRGRELISSALQAVLAYVDGNQPTNPDGSLGVLLQNQDSVSDLATALREFDHDRARIDKGATPELVLKPVARDSVENAGSLSASRKLLIQWLTVVQLWDKKVDRQFRTQAELLQFAATYAQSTAGRLKTERKKFNQGKASRPELAFYHDLIDDVDELAKQSQDCVSPFKLLLAGVMALSI